MSLFLVIVVNVVIDVVSVVDRFVVINGVIAVINVVMVALCCYDVC